jgi:LPXTG-motif cell wall-anchored protein
VVEQGGTLEVRVSGLRPGQQIAATLHSDPLPVSGIRPAGASGDTSFALAIPSDFAIGAHTLVVSAEGADPIAVPVRVVASGQLAATGAQLPLGLLFLGALAVVAGGLILVTRRRRPRDTDAPA